MISIERILGFATGVAAVLVIALAVRYFIKKRFGQQACQYDERQKAIQGVGFKLAYFTLLICVLLGGLVEVATDVSWIGLFPFAVLCMWISISVFVSYCLIRDAYITLEAKRTELMILFLIVGLMNLAVVLFSGDPLIEEGKLGVSFANLCTAVCTLYIAAFMFVIALVKRRSEGEE